MKKYLLLFVAIVVLGAGAYFSELRFLSYSYSSAPTLATSLAAQGDTLSALNATSTTVAGIDFALKAGEESYRGEVRAGATVLDAMKMISSNNGFRFVSKDFPGMGAFVESINGQRNTDGFYWILYLNGNPSQKGVSETTLTSGDSIEWRYEKGY